MTRRLLVAACLACVCGASGCGGSGDPQLKVSAAASLRNALGLYASGFGSAQVRYAFAGSDALAAQIESGARPDVLASANTQLPAELHARGLVETPVRFASNVLVLAVPARSQITSLPGAARPGVTIAVGAPTVPIGAYTEQLLARLGAVQRRALRLNIRDSEPDVTGIVGKLMTGAVDAGFVYRTDALAAGGALRAIPLPASLQPRVDYAAAVVRGGAHTAIARAFVAGLRSGPGQRDLRRYGFSAPSS